MDISKITEKLSALTREWRLLDTAIIPFRQYVVASCEMNHCGMYGKTWQCPPGVGTLEDLKEESLKYKHALFFSTCHPLEDSYDIDGMSMGRKRHEEITDEIVSFFPLDKIRAMSAEGCDLCERCTYPNAPCRYPKKARSSVEANGISVVELAQECGVAYKNEKNTVTYFSLILFDKQVD